MSLPVSCVLLLNGNFGGEQQQINYHGASNTPTK